MKLSPRWTYFVSKLGLTARYCSPRCKFYYIEGMSVYYEVICMYVYSIYVWMCNIGIFFFFSLSLSHTTEECLLISIKYWNKSRVRFSIYIPRHLNIIIPLGSGELYTFNWYIYNINWNYNFFNYANDMQRFFPKRYYIWKAYPLPPIITTNRNTYYFSYSPFDSIPRRKSEDL